MIRGLQTSTDASDRTLRKSLPGAAAMLLALAAVAGCTHPTVEVAPPLATPTAFSATGAAPAPDDWWTAFEDEQLNALVAQAMRENFSLRIAWDRLDQARAVAARSKAPLWPSLDGSAGAARTTVRTPMARTSTSNLSLGLQASYEVDLWGRIRSTRDADLLDVQAGEDDLHAAAITLAAQVARTWYALAEQRGQLKLLDQQLKTNQDYLEIITLKFRRGQKPATDVLQQRQLVETTRGDRALVESTAAVLANLLAVLVGRPPESFSPAHLATLPEMPPLPRTGVPAEWLRRRPDVRSAERRVQAADQRVAAAIADQFPRLGISFGAETSAEAVRNLFDNWLASIAANLAAPLIDGGRRRAEVERTKAVVSERINAYGQVVLASLAEVEDAIAQETRQAQYVKSLRLQLDLADQATKQTLDNYTKGTKDFTFTRYLTTLLAYQRLQRTHLGARRQLVGFRIDLYRSLAGGWDITRPAGAEFLPALGAAPTSAPADDDSATTQPAEAAGDARP